MKKIALSFIMVMLGSFAFAAGNEVYIEQDGDGDSITISQIGEGNKVGTSTTSAVFNGGVEIR